MAEALNSPFEPGCYFCFDVETEEPTPSVHVTFKSGDEGFLCGEHFDRAQRLDQCTEARLVQTGIERTMRNYGR